MCPILRGKMGLKYAARAGARASEMGGAGGARPRAYFAWLEALCLSRRYWGLRPLAPRASARQCRERSEAMHGRRCAKPSDTGMTTYDMLKGIKDSIYLPTRTKAVFSLESEGFLFDKTKRNLSVLGRRQLDYWPRRALTSSKRLSIRRWASSLRAPKLSPRARVASSG